MVRQPVRLALLIGALTAMAASPAWANHRSNDCCAPVATTNACCAPASTAAPCAPAAPAAAPCTRTITVTECVPETYTTTRKAYKYECRNEEYTVTKNVMVPETRTRQVTTYTRVPETRCETRKVSKRVTCYEDRVVNKTSYKTVQETVMKKKLVSAGHWENREECVPDHCANFRNSLSHSLSGLGRGHGHHGCSDPCNPCPTTCETQCAPAPAMKTVCRKHWVACPQYECCPVTVCKKVAVCEQVTCKVAVCKTVCEDVQVQVCSYKCVPCTRTETYCVNVCKPVCEKACRQVRVCVPYEETVTCTRMVSRQKQVEVPVAPVCTPTNNCADTCSTSSSGCCDSGAGFGGRLRGLFSGFGGGHNHGSSCGCR